MKLREYLQNINERVDNDPSILDLEVVTSKDEVGNYFTRIFFYPEVGNFDNAGGFISEFQYEDCNLPKNSTNAICVN